MTAYRCAIIGCGAKSPTSGLTSAIGYTHAEAYLKCKDTQLVACCDVVEKNVISFRDRFGPCNTYTDSRELLDRERPDIVSVCTWLPVHGEVTVAAAARGAKAIWCEKPMAHRYGTAVDMLRACRENKCRLFVNHQRRYGQPFQIARQVIADGKIGRLLHIRGTLKDGTLLDYGTHLVDMIRFLAGDPSTLWVAGQADVRKHKTYHDHAIESYSLGVMAFNNGATGIIEMGHPDYDEPVLRADGSEGFVELYQSAQQGTGTLRMRLAGDSATQAPTLAEGFHGLAYFDKALADIVRVLADGGETLIDGESGLATTEIIMAIFESARCRRRLTLPLENPDASIDALLQAAGAD